MAVRPTGPLLVDEVDHWLEGMITLRDASVRSQLVVQSLDFKLGSTAARYDEAGTSTGSKHQK